MPLRWPDGNPNLGWPWQASVPVSSCTLLYEPKRARGPLPPRRAHREPRGRHGAGYGHGNVLRGRDQAQAPGPDLTEPEREIQVAPRGVGAIHDGLLS